ncbi:MAG: cell division protein [Bacteroidetes bacterium]|nr:MAG: cell division protein [Bacteroidota bacterium]
MPKIHLTTFIKAPAERVFDLSRNISLYKKALQNRKEKISSGAASNLVSSGETVTIHARHFGKTRMITARIIEVNKPLTLVEEQVKGDLKAFRHERHFKEIDNGTIMIDMVEFEGPRDMIGSIFSSFFLKTYFEKIFQQRNELIRQYAESDKWRAVMN